MKSYFIKCLILVLSTSTAFAGVSIQNFSSNSAGCGGGTTVISGNSTQITSINGQTITTINGVTTITNNSSGVQVPSVSTISESAGVSATSEEFLAKLEKQLLALQTSYEAKLEEYNQQLQAYNNSSSKSVSETNSLRKKYRQLRYLKTCINCTQSRIARLS